MCLLHIEICTLKHNINDYFNIYLCMLTYIIIHNQMYNIHKHITYITYNIV